MGKNVALVLSGGGARGLAHIGVIQELENQGFNITSIAGTSMGAVIGGFYAAGKLEEYTSWMKTLDKLKVFKLVDFTFSKSGLIRGDKIFRAMKKFIPDIPIEQLNISFSAVAVDIIKQEEVIIKKGSLYHAMRASSAIPTIITPVKTKDQILVDGGIISNIPVHVVKRHKDDILIVVDVNAKIPFKEPKTISTTKVTTYKKKLKIFRRELKKITKTSTNNLNYFKLLSKTIDTMICSNNELLLKNYSPDIIIKVSKKASTLFDFYKAEQLIEIGQTAAKKYLKKIQ
ncbi:patatin-like phospholipase family protein [Candidatus Woesearchaeota archaeon]|nr:patatin-like phospholipase family protein [Candidatus Woesearchaeota archaeon]